MTAPDDPLLITVSCRVYRVLLAAYPRRFRRVYRDEIARCFRDFCREVYRSGGLRGLSGAWGKGVLDLYTNIPREHMVQLTGSGGPAIQPTRSCSGCYSEVQPDWQVCRICGTVLNEATTHVTRPKHTVEEYERLRRFLGGIGSVP
jgi:hypothetical protein